MSEIKISTIVPFFNIEEYMEESLDSIINQNIDDRELILVDDGSTDRSGEIAKAYAEKYPWIIYIQTDHRGPGGARNAGIRIAKGKYLNFADADDIVPDYAYGDMYEAAESSNATVVVGKPVRLYPDNRIMYSQLHERVFTKYCYETNIRENPYLLWDTTVWNKLIRRDYWISQSIEFPEKTPYQDIPATFLMHYNAEKVVMLDEIIYIWRVREGENKSITQQRFDLKNFQARLNMLRLVDSYFKEMVSEPELIRAKSFKWLLTDLNPFVNECLAVEEETFREFMRLMKEYIIEAGLESEFNKLPVLFRAKYEAVMKDDLNRLKAVRAYEAEHLVPEKTKKKGKAVIGYFPEEVIEGGQANMNPNIAVTRLTQKVTNLNMDDDKIIIEGYAFLRNQPYPLPLFGTVKASLVNLRGQTVAELKAKGRISKAALKESNTNNQGCGYLLTLFNKDISKLESGKYHIKLDWQNGGERREAILAGVKAKIISDLGENGRPIKGTSALLKTTLRRELEIVVP